LNPEEISLAPLRSSQAGLAGSAVYSRTTSLTVIDIRSYDSDMGMADLHEAARKWSMRRGLLPQPTDPSDAFVEVWKKSWLSGAAACWAKNSPLNPHPQDPARAAWQAGWHWASGHPDRRTQHHLRLAHPNRRATDSERRVPFRRAVKIGAVGVGLFAASRWGWRTLRPKRTPAET
jgi:hypothetical protein